MPHLTKDQKADYLRDGYLCPIRIFSEKEAAAHRAAVEGLERK